MIMIIMFRVAHVHLQGREVRHKAVTRRVTQRKGQMQVK